MKRTHLLVLAGGLLAFAAWHVQRDARVEVIAQGGKIKEGQPGKPPEVVIPEKYHETIQKGLDYLAKHQHKDGHWEGDGGKHPVAMTGLVGLALHMEIVPGYFERSANVSEGKYVEQRRKAADYLMERCAPERDGLLFSNHASEISRYMEGHGLATVFLAGCCRYEKDAARAKNLRDVLTRSVKYIVKAQSSQGGWYHTSKAEGHDLDAILTTAIQYQALLAAEHVGVPVPNEVLNDAITYMSNALGKCEGEKKTHARNQLAETAAALACRRKSNTDLIADQWRQDWIKFCQDEIALGRKVKLGRDELFQFFYVQALYVHGDESWDKYRTAMFDQLQAAQLKDGSWAAGEGLGVGPVYSTAVWCVVMQLARNRHPALRTPTEVRTL